MRKMSSWSPSLRMIFKALTITWTLLAMSSSGDNSVNMTTLEGANDTDQVRRTPLVLNKSQKTSMDLASGPESDQHNHLHQSLQSLLGNTSVSNTSSDAEKVSAVPHAEDGTPLTSQYATCDPKKEALLISICPSTAEEADKTMCQSNEVPPTVDTIFPVTDSVSGYHFRNVHCWRCFNQSGEPLTWSGQLFYTIANAPQNYSSLSSFLLYVDQNAAFTTWKPPSQFSYPKCEDVGYVRCTVCVPKKTHINTCSYLGRPQHRAEEMTHKCYVCTSYEAKHSLDDKHLCENIHPEEVTYISNWVNFFFLHWSRSNTMIIGQVPGKTLIHQRWVSLNCSVDLDTCSATACLGNVLLLDGICDHSFIWFFVRFILCRTKSMMEDCFRQKPRDFLDQQFRKVDQPINTTALDMFEEESDSCQYETHNSHELNHSDSDTLKDILTTPINQLIIFHQQINNFAHLQGNVVENNDSDTIEIEVSGWGKGFRMPEKRLLKRVSSTVIQTMMTAGVKGDYLFCETRKTNTPELFVSCQPVRICFREIRERVNQENQHLTSNADQLKTAGIVSGLGIALSHIMLR